jgi:hypothetical protein
MTQADSVHSTPPINTSKIDGTNPDKTSPQGALYLPTDVTPKDVSSERAPFAKRGRDEIDSLVPSNNLNCFCRAAIIAVCGLHGLGPPKPPAGQARVVLAMPSWQT